jgi:WD40 repeat protein
MCRAFSPEVTVFAPSPLFPAGLTARSCCSFNFLAMMGAAFSPDGTRVVTSSDDHAAGVWGTSTGMLINVLHGHAGEMNSAVFSPDGARIITTSDDRTVRLWDSAAGTEVSVLRGHLSTTLSAVFYALPATARYGYGRRRAAERSRGLLFTRP